MFTRINKRYLAGILGIALSLGAFSSVEARYVSDSDTDATLLDYVENQRRADRENALTEDQKQLLLDAYALKEDLREPLDKTKNVPIAVEGDELFFDEETGEFVAKGNVKIISLDLRGFKGEAVEGNLQKQDIEIEEQSHMLQLTSDQARIILDGYRTQYNYGTNRGHMEDVTGKIGHHYIKANRIEMYPQVIILYDATATKCKAKKPDYHISADKIEYYINEKTICRNIKYWIGDVILYSVSKQEFKDGEKNEMYLPEVKYTSEDGIGVADTFYFPIAPSVEGYYDVLLSQKSGIKSNGGVVYSNGLGNFTLQTGFFEDSDGKWLHKSPNFKWDYSNKIGRTPFNYSISYERGDWTQEEKRSTHTYYGGTLSLDSFFVYNWKISPSIGYSVTKESYDNSTVKGIGYDITAVRDYDEHWASYFGYHYSQQNSNNSVFDYDLDSYSKKLTAGASYKITPRDRIVAGFSFDAEKNSLEDIDYYWYHDIHCAQMITRYRAKREQIKISYSFNPW